MPFPAIPVAIGAAVVGAGAIALRLRAMAKAAKNQIIAPPAAKNVPPAPPAAPPVSVFVPPPPPAVAAALPALATNPDGSDHTQGTPFVFTTNQDAASAVAEANRRGISVHQLLLEKSGQLSPAASGDGTAAAGQKAIVSTNDPAPAGDLIIRSSPSGSAQQIGGAEKNGTVIIVDSSDATFAKIQWGGGSRLPAATGFARKAFLKLI